MDNNLFVGAKLLTQFLLANGSHYFDLPIGKYSQLIFMFESTGNNSGTVAETSFGQFSLLVNKSEKANFTFDRLTAKMNQEGGSFPNALANGAPLSCFYVYNFNIARDTNNVLEVGTPGSVNIKFQNVITTNMGTGAQCTVYGVENDLGTPVYFPKMINYDLNYATGTPYVDTLRGLANIYQIMAENTADITNWVIKRDSKVIYNAKSVVLNALSTFNSYIETYASQAYLNVKFFDGTLASLLGNSYSLEINTTTTGVLNMLITQILFNDTDKLELSLGNRNAYMESLFRNSVDGGKVGALANTEN